MDLLKPISALPAIVNPIGVGPLFIHLTQGFRDDQRRHTIRAPSCAVSGPGPVKRSHRRRRAG